MVVGIVGIAVGHMFGAGIVIYFIVKKMFNEQMEVFMNSPLQYKKDYKKIMLGMKLAKGGLWLGIGFLIFWIVYFGIIITAIGLSNHSSF